MLTQTRFPSLINCKFGALSAPKPARSAILPTSSCSTRRPGPQRRSSLCPQATSKFPAPLQQATNSSSKLQNGPSTTLAIAAFLSVGAGAAMPWPAAAAAAAAIGDLSEGLETPVQLVYLLFLLGFLVVGAFLVVRQVLIRRELEEAAKVLGDRVRSNEASSEDFFELGVILLRKKLFTQATKNLEKAKKGWEGEEEELAQVHNALGYAYFNMEAVDKAVAEYKVAVSLQPGYVTAWNNLGDAYERQKKYGPALEAYREALAYSPDNKVAQARAEFCKTRLDRAGGLIG